jgi:hypothetical protein
VDERVAVNSEGYAAGGKQHRAAHGRPLHRAAKARIKGRTCRSPEGRIGRCRGRLRAGSARPPRGAAGKRNRLLKI